MRLRFRARSSLLPAEPLLIRKRPLQRIHFVGRLVQLLAVLVICGGIGALRRRWCPIARSRACSCAPIAHAARGVPNDNSVTELTPTANAAVNQPRFCLRLCTTQRSTVSDACNSARAASYDAHYATATPCNTRSARGPGQGIRCWLDPNCEKTCNLHAFSRSLIPDLAPLFFGNPPPSICVHCHRRLPRQS